MTTYWLKLSNLQSPTLYFKHSVKSASFPLKSVVSKNREPPPYSDSRTREMKVHWTFLKNQCLITLAHKLMEAL